MRFANSFIPFMFGAIYGVVSTTWSLSEAIGYISLHLAHTGQF